jgi:hypothetical protein
MKQEFVKPWTDALRSGEYKQTKKVLKDQDGFCCLGVLQDVILKQGLIKGEWKSIESVRKAERLVLDLGKDEKGRDVTEETTYHLSVSVMNLTDIKTNVANFRREGTNECLASLNDRGVEFDIIADIIEKHWEQL